jgi:hypothetical protein
VCCGVSRRGEDGARQVCAVDGFGESGVFFFVGGGGVEDGGGKFCAAGEGVGLELFDGARVGGGGFGVREGFDAARAVVAFEDAGEAACALFGGELFCGAGCGGFFEGAYVSVGFAGALAGGDLEGLGEGVGRVVVGVFYCAGGAGEGAAGFGPVGAGEDLDGVSLACLSVGADPVGCRGCGWGRVRGSWR